MPHRGPISVAVLVDLVRTPASGGHVKCWEHLARAAAAVPRLDLTVYTFGAHPGDHAVADNVRFVALRPVFATSWLHGLVGGVDGSDLTPFHPALARRLPRHDVWHATHTMAFGATALRVRRRHARPLVTSVHTDVPALARAYTRQVADRLPTPLGRAATRLRTEDRVADLARHRRDRLLRASREVLASNEADAEEFAVAAPGVPVSLLRRGVDTGSFRPRPGGREWLAERYGIAHGDALVLFVGRIDATKGAPLLAEAVLRLRRTGRAAHLVLAGDGAAVPAITGRLGAAVTHVGHLPQAELARVYAACDVFAFPSQSETAGNVVAEAMAAGLPVVLPAGARTARWLQAPGRDGLLVEGQGAEDWAAAMAPLLDAPARRRAMGTCARQTVASTAPSWMDVLLQDVLPVWHRVAARDRPERAVPR